MTTWLFDDSPTVLVIRNNQSLDKIEMAAMIKAGGRRTGIIKVVVVAVAVAVATLAAARWVARIWSNCLLAMAPTPMPVQINVSAKNNEAMASNFPCPYG
jgi:uncharacterized membrane protein